jgi:hypothetical protein
MAGVAASVRSTVRRVNDVIVNLPGSPRDLIVRRLLAKTRGIADEVRQTHSLMVFDWI